MSTVRLSDSQFKQEVLQSKEPVIVDFWAPWCGPCMAVAPILEDLAKEYKGRLKVCKVNIDEAQTVATKYQILSIPTLLFFKDGKVTNQLVGAKSKSEIKKVIASLC
ncbi:MAG: thioredoxin [Candidatus Omnitrophota bacterium]|nr:MAG: thioredoxin [Candidatus Omnitrophota bacterium]